MDWQKRCQKIQFFSNSNALFWIVDLQEISNLEAQQAESFLDVASIEKSQRFVFEQDRKRYLITHASLRSKLGELIDQKPSEISFLKNQYGKPYIEKNEVYFNLSHTKQKAFFGIHPSSQIGVDIEDIQTTEQDDPDTFLRFWCAEEAYLKAIGTGFASQRPKLDCFSSSQGVDLFRENGTEIYVYNALIPDCKLAVCILNASI